MHLFKKIRENFFIKLLLYLLFLCLVPVLVYALVAGALAYRSAVTQISERANVQTDSILEEFERVNGEYRELLELLTEADSIQRFAAEGKTAADPELEGGTTQFTQDALITLYGVTSGHLQTMAAHVTGVYRPAGISTKTLPAHYMYPFNSGWGIFAMAAQNGSVVLRVNDRNANNLPGVCYSLAKTVLDENGAVTGYVVFDVYRSVCSSLLSRFTLEQGETVYFVDGNNFILYTNSSDFDADRLNVLPEEYRIESSNGDRVVNHSLTTAYGIRVVTVTPFTAAKSASGYVSSGAIVAGIVSALLCLIISFLVWRDISRPLAKLTEDVQKVEKGDLSARVDLGNREDEFGKLGGAVNQMTGQIQTLIRNIEEKQKSLRVAETSALQAQINPHFLYNTLDLIKWNSKLGNNEEATRITVLLGKLLRSMADFSGDIVPVKEELDIVNQYLTLQQIHYGDKLKIDLKVEEEIFEERIPKLILQPLVENAIVHGVDSRKETCTVEIRGYKKDGHVVFEVKDNGPGMDEETRQEILSGNASSRRGIGTSNVRKRAMLYGDEACGIRVESTPGEGSCFILTLNPVRETNDGGPHV